MIGSFRIRLLVVIVLSALAGFLMQASPGSRQTVEPVIKYIMGKNYNVEAVFSRMAAKIGSYTSTPVTTDNVLQLPCRFTGIDRNYGWFFNLKENKQEFYPGINLKVEDNSLVRPVMPGQVEKITVDGNTRSILIKHDSGYYSLYGGLKEILVTENDKVILDSVLGKTNKTFYFELRNQDGPVDPQYIFK
ncbi:MAG TPA: M23 family metallopeptidase [Syntrophomonadaceae bacterium]|nr:M23 family metallopeptidase [Syntrophomonadaceae bacterium]